MSTETLPTTSYAVLGFLHYQPMSRYDLVRAAEESIANFWTIAKSQVYGELKRLESLGLVKGTDIRQTSLPDKRVYEITPEGLEALRVWLADPKVEPDRFRSEFLVKLFFARHMPASSLRELFRNYRTHAEGGAAMLEGIATELAKRPGFEYVRATARLGAAVTRAVVDWANEIEKDLPKLRRRKSRG